MPTAPGRCCGAGLAAYTRPVPPALCRAAAESKTARLPGCRWLPPSLKHAAPRCRQQLGWQATHCDAAQAVRLPGCAPGLGMGFDDAECIRRWQLPNAYPCFESCSQHMSEPSASLLELPRWHAASYCLAALEPPAVCCHVSRGERGVRSRCEAGQVLMLLLLLVGWAGCWPCCPPFPLLAACVGCAGVAGAAPGAAGDGGGRVVVMGWGE